MPWCSAPPTRSGASAWSPPSSPYRASGRSSRPCVRGLPTGSGRRQPRASCTSSRACRCCTPASRTGAGWPPASSTPGRPDVATPAQWLAGARPRTLPAAVAPVFVGTGAAAALDGFRLVPAVLALVVALALQVGVNYANDYSDGRRGTDSDRVGPMRLVGSGAASAPQVLRAALTAFAVAGVAGLALAALSSWWLVAVGAVCIVAAWTYTGGPIPYGYRALGEVFVFVFFGLVAVVGTTFAQTRSVEGLAVAASVPVGLLIVAILVVNNLRDIAGDTA